MGIAFKPVIFMLAGAGVCGQLAELYDQCNPLIVYMNNGDLATGYPAFRSLDQELWKQ